MNILKKMGGYSVVLLIHFLAALVFVPIVLFIAATEPRDNEKL